jgi:hypothetical protein
LRLSWPIYRAMTWKGVAPLIHPPGASVAEDVGREWFNLGDATIGGQELLDPGGRQSVKFRAKWVLLRFR